MNPGATLVLILARGQFVAGVRNALEEALGIYLANDTRIAAVTNGRVFHGRVPQRIRDATPSLVFRIITRNPDTDLDGDSGYVRARVQLDAIGKDAIEAEALSFALRSAVNRLPPSLSGVEIAAAWIDSGGDDDDAEPTGTDSNRTRYHFDAMIHYRETLD